MLTGVNLVACGVAYASCEGIQLAAQQAKQRSDFANLRRLHAEADYCSDAEKAVVGRLLGTALWAQYREEAQASGVGSEALLVEATRVAALWQPHAALADVHRQRKEYVFAAQGYQRAVDIINDAHLTPTPPSPKVIGSLLAKGEEAQQLAPVYVATTRSRSGDPAGLASEDVRGFQKRKRPTAVEYITNEATFTPKGADAARDLAEEVKLKNPSRITLTGHTDERGEPGYNKVLSRKRAVALREYLQSKGVRASIEVVARGEEDPPRYFDAAALTQAEKWQIARRVEVEFHD